MDLVPKTKAPSRHPHSADNNPSERPSSWKFQTVRLLITIVGGTLLAQALWITFATVLALPSAEIERWYIVMLGIHIASWWLTWKWAGRRLAKWK
jgi:hypothetical protein